MAIEIKETFQIEAPIDRVWNFLVDPEQVVRCIPGADLEEVVDERHLTGNIRVKVGPIVVAYKGQAEFTNVDEASHTVHVVGQGREKGGSGRAKGTMSSTLRGVDGDATEVTLVSSVDVTGRVMQLGARMIEGVSHQLLQEFVSCCRATLEAPEAEATEGETATGRAPGPRPEAKPISLIPLLFRAVWSAITGFFKRLFGRKG